MSNYERIQDRISTDPELAQYSDLLLYDWEEEEEHTDWVCSADVGEIIEWAEGIRADEKQQREENEITDPANW